MMENKKAIVIGAGVSGLSAAWELKKRGLEVIVLEKNANVGGVVSTFSENGYKAESGTNSVMVTSQKLLDFINEVGLESKMEVSKPVAKKRFFARYSKPRAVPMNPISLLFTRLFSFFGKIRIFCEPFVKKHNPDSEPSIAEFVEKRFGRDVLDYAINPFMAGVYGGDPKKLSIKYAFAPFWNLEQKYGSVIKGAIKSMKEKRATGNIFKPKMISFKDGMATLISKLSGDLNGSIKTSVQIISIDATADGRWEVSWGTNTEDVCEIYDVIVLAVPSSELKNLHLGGSLANALSPLDKITYAPVSTYTMGFERKRIKHKLDGFGVLVPEKEDFSILGSLFVSSIFSGRSPDGCATLTNYIGGMRHPELASLPQEELREIILRDIKKLLGVSGEPLFEKLFYWEHAIPQYNIGYGDIIAAADEVERSFSNIALIGAWRGGVGAGTCIENGVKAADRLVDGLK